MAFHQERYYENYISKIENTYALLEASGHHILESERVEIVLVGLLPEFESVITIASFSSEPLPVRKLVDILLDFENRQQNMVMKTLFQVNMVGLTASKHIFPWTMAALRGGHASYGGCGQSTRGCV